jgi:hypothetical protein
MFERNPTAAFHHQSAPWILAFLMFNDYLDQVSESLNDAQRRTKNNEF